MLSAPRSQSQKSSQRTSHNPLLLSPHGSNNARPPSGTKRARSPDGQDAQHSAKRVKDAQVSPEKDARRAQREAQKEEFRVKYTKAFPGFNFYFDLDDQDPALRTRLEGGVAQLGATIDDFFSNGVTHFITAQPVPESIAEKENVNNSRLNPSKAAASLSPSRSRNWLLDESMLTQNHESLVRKAQSLGIKIWRVDKLESVLERLITLPSPPIVQPGIPRKSVSRLLQSERVHGSSETDPLQKRHDFHYFKKGSYFILIEDAKSELATIAAAEYPVHKERNGTIKPTWPVLHCHPHARGPFVPFDDKEKKRWEKQQALDKASGATARSRHESLTTAHQGLSVRTKAPGASAKQGDLRRSVSLNNLQRRISREQPEPEPEYEAEGAGDAWESANASGYLVSGTGGYVAASGNSISITSTVDTTSNNSASARSAQVPPSLQGRRQVVTSRSLLKNSGTMGPPGSLPDKPRQQLRKSKSTGALRLPKRDEGSKPGYCESCRMKFESFKEHIQCKRHRRFAEDESNFAQLDYVLNQVRRRTREELEESRLARRAMMMRRSGVDSSPFVADSNPISEWDFDVENENEIPASDT